MREPVLVEGPYFTPGHCMICGGNQGKMIDTCVDIPGDGRMYLCLKTCVPLIAKACRWLTPEQGDALLERLGEATTEMTEAKAELERERENRVVSLDDALRMIREAQPVTVGAPADTETEDY